MVDAIMRELCDRRGAMCRESERVWLKAGALCDWPNRVAQTAAQNAVAAGIAAGQNLGGGLVALFQAAAAAALANGALPAQGLPAGYIQAANAMNHHGMPMPGPMVQLAAVAPAAAAAAAAAAPPPAGPAAQPAVI
jgi:hypothetical protein